MNTKWEKVRTASIAPAQNATPGPAPDEAQTAREGAPLKTSIGSGRCWCQPPKDSFTLPIGTIADDLKSDRPTSPSPSPSPHAHPRSTVISLFPVGVTGPGQSLQQPGPPAHPFLSSPIPPAHDGVPPTLDIRAVSRIRRVLHSHHGPDDFLIITHARRRRGG